MKSITLHVAAIRTFLITLTVEPKRMYWRSDKLEPRLRAVCMFGKLHTLAPSRELPPLPRDYSVFFSHFSVKILDFKGRTTFFEEVKHIDVLILKGGIEVSKGRSRVLAEGRDARKEWNSS